MTTTTGQGERLARLEGAYDHLASKADVESLRGELKSLRGELAAFKWQISLGVPLLTVVVSQILDRLL